MKIYNLHSIDLFLTEPGTHGTELPGKIVDQKYSSFDKFKS